MTIRTKLRAIALASVLLALILCMVFFIFISKAEKEARKEAIAVEIMRNLYELGTIRSDFVLFHEKRAEVQWQIKQKQIGTHLDLSREYFDNPEEQAIIKEMEENLAASEPLFRRIKSNHERNASNKKKAALVAAGDSRQDSELLLKTYNVLTAALRLYEMSSKAHESAHAKSILVAVITAAVMAMAVIASSLSINRLIAGRIRRLVEGAAVIGHGSLDYRIEEQGADELTSVARALNEMAAGLEESHTTLENLEKEKTERIRSEAESKFLASIIRNIPEAVCAIDHKGNVISWNRGAERMLGYTASEIIGQPVTVTIPNGIAKNELEHCIGLLRTEGSFTGYESTRRAKDGKIVPVEITAMALCGSDGESSSYTSIMRDITERKRVEGALRKHEEDFRRLSQEFHGLLDAIPDRLLLLDRNLRIVWANRTASELAGKASSDPIGQHCHMLFKESETPCVGCPVAESFRTGEPVTTTYTATDRRIWDLRTIPLKDDIGRVVNVIEVGRDITDHRKLEAQYLQAQKMEAIGQLAAGIAHDFNNLLGAMVNYAQLLQLKSPQDGLVREFTDQILVLTDRATALTQGLLAFSRKQETNTMPVDLNSILARLQKFFPRILGEDIDIVIQPDCTACTVMADPLQIEQALMNLATNARDAMPQGGVLAISTGVQEIDGPFVHAHGFGEPGPYAVLTFSDSGAGMDEETRKKIFDPFFTTKDVGKGTGLGLAMVYGIVKQHKGYITVYSELGQGTVFRMYLPLTGDAGTQQQRQTAGPETETGNAETILLAEDDELLRDGMVRILENFGYRLLVAENGPEALELFREYDKDIALVLMDVIMPKRNGKEIAEAIRKARPDMPVLFISGYPGNASSGQRILSDTDECLTKPVPPMHLLKRIRELIDRQQDLKEVRDE